MVTWSWAVFLGAGGGGSGAATFAGSDGGSGASLYCTASLSGSGCGGPGHSPGHPERRASSEAAKPERGKSHASELRNPAVEKQTGMECLGHTAPSPLLLSVFISPGDC